MRIKFNDKIYRLKEIESGVDSLMELVEEPKYKHGDFLMTRNRIAFILDREGKRGEAYFLFATDMDRILEDDIQEGGVWTKYCGRLKDALVANQKATEAIIKGLKKIGKQWNAEKKCIEDIPVYKDGDFVYEDGRIMIIKSYPNMYHALIYPKIDLKVSYNESYAPTAFLPELSFRAATQEEKQLLIDAMGKDGKCWNKDKRCIEDMQKRKFKAGDKVTLKSGCTSNPNLAYYSLFDEYIGKELIVIDYTESGNVKCNNGLRFAEDWLEPWSDEPNVGDWVIFWYIDREIAKVGILTDIKHDVKLKYGIDGLSYWLNAVKWDGTKDHLEKIRSGKV